MDDLINAVGGDGELDIGPLDNVPPYVPLREAVFLELKKAVLEGSLKPGQVVIDNLSSHKGSRVRELIEGRACELMYLPPTRPIYNLSKKRLPSSRRC